MIWNNTWQEKKNPQTHELSVPWHLDIIGGMEVSLVRSIIQSDTTTLSARSLVVSGSSSIHSRNSNGNLTKRFGSGLVRLRNSSGVTEYLTELGWRWSTCPVPTARLTVLSCLGVMCLSPGNPIYLKRGRKGYSHLQSTFTSHKSVDWDCIQEISSIACLTRSIVLLVS